MLLSRGSDSCGSRVWSVSRSENVHEYAVHGLSMTTVGDLR